MLGIIIKKTVLSPSIQETISVLQLVDYESH